MLKTRFFYWDYWWVKSADEFEHIKEVAIDSIDKNGLFTE